MPLTRLPIVIAALIAASPAWAQPCATVQVHNVRPQQGHLMVAAYASEQGYGKSPMAALRIAAGEATMQLEVCGLSGDTVALAVFQDLDGDGKMGRNPLGIPTEPWGASGSPGMFGPNWENSRVPLNGKPIVVRMSQ